MLPSSTLWMVLAPAPRGTRVLATLPGQRPLLRATLRPDPLHPRALPTLLEALALWEGRTVHAVLAVDSPFASCAPRLCDALSEGHGAPLFHLSATHAPDRAPRDDSFADLTRLLWREAAR